MNISYISGVGMALVAAFCAYCFYLAAGIRFLGRTPKIKDPESGEMLAEPSRSSREFILLYVGIGLLGVFVFAYKISNQSLNTGWVNVFGGLASAFGLGRLTLTDRHKKKLPKTAEQNQ